MKARHSKRFQTILQVFTRISAQYLLVYQGRDRSRSIRRLRVATVKNNREYALIHETDMSNYALQRQSAQTIIDSFTWLN